MGMASFPVVVLDIDVPHVLAVDAERHAKIPRQPHAPLAASCAFERMQSPTGKPCDLLDMSRLFDGVKDILQLRHKIGVDRLIWGSDFAHASSDWPNSQRMLDQTFVGVPADERRRILRDNVAELYGIEVAQASASTPGHA